MSYYQLRSVVAAELNRIRAQTRPLSPTKVRIQYEASSFSVRNLVRWVLCASPNLLWGFSFKKNSALPRPK